MRKPLSILLLLLLASPFAGAKTKKSHSSELTRLTIQPQKTFLKPTPFSMVVIDAGHGGRDPGGIPQNLFSEKYAALDVALRLNHGLQKAGFQTLLTRSNDTFIPLDTRVAIANAHPGSVFVSIHFDASPRRFPAGIDAHYYSASSAPLAASIVKNLIASTHAENRGIKRDRFRVLRNNRNRAVLVECGFLTNPQEASLAERASYRQKLADQICIGIVDYRKSISL